MKLHSYQPSTRIILPELFTAHFTNTDTNTDTYTYTNADTDTETNTDTNTSTNTNTDNHTNTDTDTTAVICKHESSLLPTFDTHHLPGAGT